MLKNAIQKLAKNINDINPYNVIPGSKLGTTLIMVNIKYSYTTNRGNTKIGSKFFVFNEVEPDLEKELQTYVNNYNRNKSYRKLLNVKFLSSEIVMGEIVC